MQYNDSIDDSRLFLRLALENMGRYQLPTDPLNYCVWYEYASGKNKALNLAVDNHVEQSRGFSPDMSQQFFNRFIQNGKDKLISLIHQKLQGIFEKVFGAIKIANKSFVDSGQNLESIHQSLFSDMSSKEIEIIVDKVKKEINLLEFSSDYFKERLQQANAEVDQLRKKMEYYRKEALFDPLTGITNRRGFEKKLSVTLADASENKKMVCLIIADIDHFKKINDRHGHLVGDNVIRMVASTIKENIKGRDLVARIGGEEFAILLPDTHIGGAMKLAEDIRQIFTRLDLKKKNSGESLGTVTLSFGVTTYKNGDDSESFFNRADQALYNAKNTGRNKVSGI